MTLPLVTITAPVVVPPQPTLVTTQAPSKFAPPPRAARRGSARSGLPGAAGLAPGLAGLASGSTARRAGRGAGNDFLSFAVLPPAPASISAGRQRGWRTSRGNVEWHIA